MLQHCNEDDKIPSKKNPWLLFIMSHPGKSTTPRIRLWRLLKGLGAAGLRDAVHLLPYRATWHEALGEEVQRVQPLGGVAYLLMVEPDAATDAHFEALFNRSADYAALMDALAQWRATLTTMAEAPARRLLHQMQRDYEVVV